MQPAKNCAMWCKKYFPGPFGSCATVVKEKEEDEEEDMGKSPCHFLHKGTPSLGGRVSYVHSLVLASSWEASFASFQSYSGLA